MAERGKKKIHNVQMTEGKRAIIQQLFQENDLESVRDIQDALKKFSWRHDQEKTGKSR